MTTRFNIRRALGLAVTILTLVAGTATVRAAAFFWNHNGATSNWTEGANWSTGVAPPNDNSAELYFGNIPFGGSYLTTANLTTNGLIQNSIGRMVFLPAAGAYTVIEPSQPPNVTGPVYIFLTTGGIINESPNPQTFQPPIFVQTNPQTLDAGSGGLILTEGIGFDAAVTFTGTSGAIVSNASLASYGPVNTAVTKTGTNTLYLDQGAVMYLTKLNVTGGSVQFRGNQAGSFSGVYSAAVTGGAAISVINGSDLVLGRVFAPTATTLQINAGSLGVSGAGSSLTVARAAAGDSVLSTTSGNGGTGSLSFSSQATGAFDSLTIGGTGAGFLSIQSPSAVTGNLATIGLNAGASGSATVNGPNASWTNGSDIVVGQSGTGGLEISGGGKVTNLRTHFGFNAGSNGSVTVSDPGSSLTSSGSFFIGNGGSGSLQVLNGGVASTAGNSYLGFSAGASGSATVSGAGSTWNTAGTLAIGGNLAASGGSGYLQIENGGTVNTGSTILYSTGEVALQGATTFTGPITSYGGAVHTFSDTALANNITLGAGGIKVVSHLSGSTTSFSGTISGSGGLSYAGLGSGAALRLTGNSSYTGATTVNSGTLAVDGSITSATTVNSGATLGGAGTVGPINVNSGGTISPGNSPGTLTTGDAVLSGGGSYALELRTDGTGTVGEDWDSLAVNGALDISALSAESPYIVSLHTLDGGNNRNPLEVWDPAVGHTWSSIISTSAGLVGGFDSTLFQIDVTDFQSPTNGTFSLVQNGANLDLQYVAAISPLLGDYNQNGIVDAADYTVWRDSLGATGTGLAADGDGNGTVDQGDYDVWQNNFGATFGGGSGAASVSSATVSEPATLTMSVLLVFCISLRRWQRVAA